MSNRYKVPEGAEQFLPPNEIEKLAKVSWQPRSREQEGFLVSPDRYPYKYSAYRKEEGHFLDSDDDIAHIHGESFVSEVIPKLLSQKKAGSTFRVLDVGAGPGLYADELRKNFENNDYGVKFEVYSTGLSKKAARVYRKKKNLPPLNKEDLKWRSISELSNFPEFDLIIDSYGEHLYTEGYNADILSDPERKKYFEMIFAKLKGYASIYPTHFLGQKFPEWFLEMAEKYKVSVVLKGDALKISKLT